MKYVDSKRLIATIERGTLKLDEAIIIAKETAWRLQAAHKKAIIH